MIGESLRIARLLWGLFLYAAGIVLTVHANLGVSPWDVFHQGVSRQLGLTLGMANVVAAGAIVLFCLLMKERIGFGTISNMLLIGIFMDFLMLGKWIPEMRTFGTGLVMLIAGLFVIALASYFYIGAGYGAGPRDSLMVIMTKRAGLPAGVCRVIVEGLAVLTGWVLGGNAGVGTVIAALGIGFAVQAVFTLLRFDVRTVRQESFYETCARLGSRIRDKGDEAEAN